MNDTKVSFCSALHQKYASEHLASEYEDVKISFSRVSRFQDHSSKIVLALDGCCINCSGEENAIRQVCPNLQELDLSHNCLFDWNHVIQIIMQLERLSFLNLSHNPLHLSHPLNDVQIKHKALHNLALNSTKVSFGAVCNILEMCPSLEELHLSLNEYETVPNIDHQYRNIKSLHFASNNIKSWFDVQNIGKLFPALKVLVLCENHIEDICSVGDEFPFLEQLSLANNKINDWNSLEKLRTFSKLNDVRLNNIPLLRDLKSEKERVFLLMAALPRMNKINGANLNELEREDAERYFIRYYKSKAVKPLRYHELVNVHGELFDLVDVKLGERVVVTLLITGNVERSIPMQFDTLTLTSDVYKTISKMFNLKSNQFRLLFKEKEINHTTIMSPRDAKYLYSFYPNDGDEIELQRLDID